MDMKRSNVFLTLVLLMALGLAAPASAQYINFQAYGGYTAILGSDYFQDGYDDGWHIGAGVGFGFIPALPISISAEYSEFRVDEEGLLRQNDAPAGAAIDLD